MDSPYSFMLGKKITGVSVSSNFDKTPTGIRITLEDGSELSVSENYIEGYGWGGLYIRTEPSK